MKPGSLSSGGLRVVDENAAKALTDPRTVDFLDPFFGLGCSVKEAADRVGVSIQVMHYWAGRFVELGLLEVAAERPRRGRPVKLYRTTAQEFFVPFVFTSAETLEAYFRRYYARWQEALIKGLVKAFVDGVDDPYAWGLRIFGRDAAGRNVDWSREGVRSECSVIEVMDAPGVPAIFSSWEPVELDEAEARVLQAELLSLWRRYRTKQPQVDRAGRRTYLFRMGLAPLE